MNDYLKNRHRKQLISSLVFIIIIIGGWFYPILGYFIPLCMALGVGSGFFVGRKWCDWTCPRGSFFDVWMRPLSPKKEIPQLFKSIPFKLIILSVLMILMVINLIYRWFDPVEIGKFFVILLTITTAVGIVLALLIHPRSWCSFCPIGTLIYFTGKSKKQNKN